MEEIRRKLVQSGVIGRVLDDFNPRIKLFPFYGLKRISLGDQLTPAEVQRQPTLLEYDYHFLDLEFQETFKERKLVVLLMTDPEALRGEYLLWLTVQFFCTGPEDFPWMDLMAYEAPRPAAHTLVLTLFQANDRFKSVLTIMDNANNFRRFVLHNSRENFSTRNFVRTNALGSPLGAAFFNINDDNDNESEISDDCVSSVGSNAVESESSNE